MIGKSLDRINALFDRRLASRPSWVVLAELFLGMGWLRAAIAKIFDPDWWAGQAVADFAADHEPNTIGWYRPILEHLILAQPAAWAAVVLVLELAIAAALLTCRRIGVGLAVAIFLNVNFLLIGSPNPSVFYLMLQLGLVLWFLETSSAPATSLPWLRRLTVTGLVLAILCVPYMRTMDPQLVIDDPALVLGMWAGCGAIAAMVARRRVRREKLRQDLAAIANDDVGEVNLAR